MSVVTFTMSLADTKNFKCSVSSVLNKDIQQNGKQFMFDGEEDTAWSSNEGKPQWINVQFEKPVAISSFSFQFQGGFAGKNGNITIENADGTIICNEPFYPEDINSVQNFQLQTPITDNQALKIKFIFECSTDFFGRIIVYNLKLFE